MSAHEEHNLGRDADRAVVDDMPKLTPLEELRLVEAHGRGDPGAIGRLLRAYQRRIFSVCYRMVRNEHDARDLTQDTMLKIMQGLESYDARSKLSTWIIRVAMNTCLSHLRKQRLRRHGSLEAGWADTTAARPWRSAGGSSGEPPPEGRVQQQEMRSVLGTALHGLDPAMRGVLVLRDLQDLDYHQIAEVLEVPVGTVKSRLFRARLALRAAVEMELGRHRTDDR